MIDQAELAAWRALAERYVAAYERRLAFEEKRDEAIRAERRNQIDLRARELGRDPTDNERVSAQPWNKWPNVR